MSHMINLKKLQELADSSIDLASLKREILGWAEEVEKLCPCRTNIPCKLGLECNWLGHDLARRLREAAK